MNYFDRDFLSFFEELRVNNSKDWFDQHRKRYFLSVKEPFEAFLQDLIDEIRKYDKNLVVQPKDCLLRINRDIRFSKDKTPYNTHYTAFVSRGGRKDKSIPGLFLRFSPDKVGIMGGCYRPSKGQLHSLRTTIARDIEGFRAVVSEDSFASKFGQLQGEEHKRIPKEFQAIHLQEPLIARKQFYFMTELSPGLILGPGLLPEMMEYWHAARPVNEYLIKAMQYGV